MKIEKIIIDSVNLSKATNIPVLFLSNPGLGKTTILSRYAAKNNMHLETLIGSRFSPEEISGYMVNNGLDHLQHLSPEWFDRIIKKEQEGISTLLFIDELSTCSEAVQGSLLSLIFDRSIGSGKKLPDDCIIIAAANYASNLSPTMNILSPTLNRFVLINLNDNYSALDMTEEFLSEPEDFSESYKGYNFEKLSQEQIDLFKKNFKEFWKDTFIKYCDPESAVGILDISNQNLDGLYSDCQGSIYNFISGRTLSYLQRFILAYIQCKTNNPELLNKIIDGLVGGGTYSFKEEKQQQHYLNYIHKEISKLILLKKKESKELPALTGNISKDVATYMVSKENLEISPSEELVHMVKLVDEISERFTIKKVKEIKTPEEIASFTSDFEALAELQQYSSQYPTSANICNNLTKVGMDYYALYCDILGVKQDFNQTFGISSSIFTKVCFIRKKNADGKYGYKRVGLRISDRFAKPAFYAIPSLCTLVEAKLTEPVHISQDIEVFVFDNGFKFISYDDFAKAAKKAA